MPAQLPLPSPQQLPPDCQTMPVRQIGNLRMLKYLQLNENKFTGKLPTELGSLELELCLLVNSQALGDMQIGPFRAIHN